MWFTDQGFISSQNGLIMLMKDCIDLIKFIWDTNLKKGKIKTYIRLGTSVGWLSIKTIDRIGIKRN